MLTPSGALISERIITNSLHYASGIPPDYYVSILGNFRRDSLLAPRLHSDDRLTHFNGGINFVIDPFAIADVHPRENHDAAAGRDLLPDFRFKLPIRIGVKRIVKRDRVIAPDKIVRFI